MKKIFITGGGGYVGSALADYLVTKDYKVLLMICFFMVKMYFQVNQILK